MKRRKKFVVLDDDRTPTAMAAQQAQQSLAVTYSGDYDILSLDPIVRQLISDHVAKSAVELEAKLQHIQERINTCCVVIEIRELNMAKIDITTKLTTLRSNALLNRYVSASVPLLIAYRDMPLTDRVIDAASGPHSQSASEVARERTVALYMSVLEGLRLPTITITKEKVETKDKTGACTVCNTPLFGCTPLMSGHILCSVCGSSNKPKSSATSSKGYDALSNLLKTFKRYICVIEPKCDIEDVKVRLDDYFREKGDKDGAHYRAMALDEHGRKEGTSIDDLCLALKMKGYDDLYRHYMYVGHHYYGWKIPDLKHLEEAIIRNFRLKQEVWDNEMTESEKGGQSNICAEYRLCRECQHAGHECDLEDFKVSRKPRTLEKYDNGYAIMCKRSGFEDIFTLG